MSWGVSSSGSTKAVAAEIDKQLAKIIENKYVTDEAELRQVSDAREVMAKVLGDFTGSTGVTAGANGSLSSGRDGVKNYSFEMSIKPLWNWAI